MAIQTIKATIQMRKGAEQNFDPSQMTAGEWAVSTDSKKVWMCFAPGIVRRMSTYEAFEQDMREIQLILATCQNIQAAVERFMQLAQQHSTQAEEWSVTSKSWAVGGTGTREGENTNNSQFWSNQSKAEADRAKEEADRAAAIANFDIDSELSETSVNPVQNKVITNFLANLKSVAFTGKYSDLTEKLPLINNYLTTEEGVGAADAKLAADLKNQIDKINGNLGKIRIEKIATLNGGTTSDTAATIKSIKNAALLLFTYRYLGRYAIANSICIPKRTFTSEVRVYNYEFDTSGSGKSAKVTYVSDTKVTYNITDANWKIDIDAVFFS